MLLPTSSNLYSVVRYTRLSGIENFHASIAQVFLEIQLPLETSGKEKTIMWSTTSSHFTIMTDNVPVKPFTMYRYLSNINCSIFISIQAKFY